MTDAARNSPQAGIRQAAASVPAPRPHRLRQIAAVAGFVIGGAAVALVVGFAGFAESIVNAAPPLDARAQGIVVLTGGTARIDGALQLLVEGHAERLLISGVNPTVTLALGQGCRSSSFAVLDCCVDLDRQAQNTIGNAVETRHGRIARGFSSLIVVTSDYHMPRSHDRARRGDARQGLIAFPVSNPELHLGDWWRDPDAFGLLLREYGKYLVAEARLMLARAMPGTAEPPPARN